MKRWNVNKKLLKDTMVAANEGQSLLYGCVWYMPQSSKYFFYVYRLLWNRPREVNSNSCERLRGKRNHHFIYIHTYIHVKMMRCNKYFLPPPPKKSRMVGGQSPAPVHGEDQSRLVRFKAHFDDHCLQGRLLWACTFNVFYIKTVVKPGPADHNQCLLNTAHVHIYVCSYSTHSSRSCSYMAFILQNVL